MKQLRKHIIELTENGRTLLREKIKQAYKTRNPNAHLETTGYRGSLYYELLRADMQMVVKDMTIPSDSTLKEFFTNEEKFTITTYTHEVFDRYCASCVPETTIMHAGSSQHKSELRLGIENKLLTYYKEKVTLAIMNIDELDVSHEALTFDDVCLLEKLQPLNDCILDIKWTYIKDRLAINQNIVQGLKIVTPLERLIAGFYIIYPLTPECVELIEKGELIKSDKFTSSHITSDFSKARGLYISIVYAHDRFSRAILLMTLLQHLNRTVTNHPNIKTLYTRPVTDDGMRNALKNNFCKMEKTGIHTITSEKFMAEYKRPQ